MPLDYTHQHLSSSIMEVGSPQTPISGAQTVRLLGPFHIDWETFTIGSAGMPVGTIPAGSLLVKAMMFITEYIWDEGDADPTTLGLTVRDPVDPGVQGVDVTTYDPAQQVLSNSVRAAETAYATSQPSPVSVYAITDLLLYVYITTGGQPLQGGAADVYALIAELSA